jgi:RND family efflux transporter MFP subunit
LLSYKRGHIVAKLKYYLIPTAILVAGIIGYTSLKGMKKPPEEKIKVDKTPIVAVETVTLAPLTLTVSSYGVVKPKYETELVAQVTGQIVELSETFVRGGFVKKGQLLARIDPSDFDAALIEAQANLASAQASLETEKAQGKVAEREWQRIKDMAPSELSLRKPQLAQEMARVKAAEAGVLRAKRNLERTEIKAPYDAMVESRNIGLGSFVSAGTPVGKLLGTAIAEIRLPVADNQLEYLVAQGKHAEVNLTATYAGKPATWKASIARNEGVIDATSRMTYLVAKIDDPYHLKTNSNEMPLRFGAYVNAEILGVSLASATKVPRYLVNQGQVPILDENSTLHYAKIAIVREDGADVIVASGLQQGDRLIVSALDYPVDGMKLNLMDESDNNEELAPAQQVDEKQTTQIASLKE